MAGTKEKQYILNDDEQEAQRLNFQHHLLLKLSDGHLLHPSIKRNKIVKVADVGTGTGIWLKDVSKLMDGQASDSEQSHQYDGFDITSGLFSLKTDENLRFFQHDTLQPFPQEFHSTYDLVHIRFMALAFKGPDWTLAVKNVLELLKAGGYLQWDEFEQGLWSHDPSFKKVGEMLALGHALTSKLGFSKVPSLDVLTAFEECGLLDIESEDYSSSRHPELASDYRIWGTSSSRAGWLPVALLLFGKAGSKEEADEMAKTMLVGWDEEYAQGCTPLMPWKMMVGRKP